MLLGSFLRACILTFAKRPLQYSFWLLFIYFSMIISTFGLKDSKPSPSFLPLPRTPRHSLDGSIRVVSDDCTGMPQDIAGNPALGCGALISGGSEHQKHVLLVAGQNLHDLSLVDIYLILLHCRVIVCHQHGGDIATAATFTLQASVRSRESRGRKKKDQV